MLGHLFSRKLLVNISNSFSQRLAWLESYKNQQNNVSSLKGVPMVIFRKKKLSTLTTNSEQ